MLDAIYNSTSEAWSFIDKELKIKFSNRAARLIAESLFGREVKVGDSFLDYVLPDLKEEFLAYCKQVLEGTKINFQSRQGTQWWDILLEPVYDRGRVEILGISYIVKDISLIKEKEQHIISQNELLKEITWHQSHGLRRHVANILALCDLLNNHTADFEQEREEFINFILQESKSLDDLIHKIVALSTQADLGFEN